MNDLKHPVTLPFFGAAWRALAKQHGERSVLAVARLADLLGEAEATWIAMPTPETPVGHGTLGQVAHTRAEG